MPLPRPLEIALWLFSPVALGAVLVALTNRLRYEVTINNTTVYDSITQGKFQQRLEFDVVVRRNINTNSGPKWGTQKLTTRITSGVLKNKRGQRVVLGAFAPKKTPTATSWTWSDGKGWKKEWMYGTSDTSSNWTHGVVVLPPNFSWSDGDHLTMHVVVSEYQGDGPISPNHTLWQGDLESDFKDKFQPIP